MFADKMIHWRRRFAMAVGIAVLMALPTAWSGADYLHRLGIDFLLPARHALYGPRDVGASDVVVVVIDEETHRTAPFSETPEVAWTPYLATVIEAIAGAEPRVMGLDLIYPKSLDSPDLLPGFDKPLLVSLMKSGRRGKLVLGHLRLSQQEIRPYRGQIMAVGGVANLAPVNLLVDVDNVIRRHPARFDQSDGSTVRSFAAELAVRGGAADPEGDFLINYNTGANTHPTYSLADLHACAQSGKPEFFEAFRDKIVLFGVDLDVEDRHLPSKRFAVGTSNHGADNRCVIAFNPDRFGDIVHRRTIPGVFIHAAAIDTLARDGPLRLQPVVGRLLTAFSMVLVYATVFFLLRPLLGLIAGAILAGLDIARAIAAFESGLVLPVIMTVAAGLLTYTAVYTFRYVMEYREKRWIKEAFDHYLAPALVERLVDDPSVIDLGGEKREVTAFFTDLQGFTGISEILSDRPDVLLTILNRYLSVVSEIIEKRGGYIDKYIGDAVMAVWGVPLPDDEAERHAVEAALDCQPAFAAFNKELAVDYPDLPPLITRIGINSGTVIAGNMGSKTRINYTVAGDAVNLAARLEGASKTFGTHILIGETTAREVAGFFVCRQVDFYAVRGHRQAIHIYEVIGREGEVAQKVIDRLYRFEEALQLYRQQRFTDARAIFRELRAKDTVAALYVVRCDRYIAVPPGDGWDGHSDAQD